jgi:hypothetical protein
MTIPAVIKCSCSTASTPGTAISAIGMPLLAFVTAAISSPKRVFSRATAGSQILITLIARGAIAVSMWHAIA